MFYLLAPFLVRLRSRYLISIVLLLGGLKYVVFGSIIGAGDPWTYRFFGFELIFFILGVLAFRWWKMFGSRFILLGSSKAQAFLIWAYLLVVYLAAPRVISLFTNPFWSTYVAPLILVTSITVAIPFLFQSTKDWKFDAKIGAYSYPIYLVHLLVISTLGWIWSVADPRFVPQNRLLVFLTLLLAIFVGSWPLVRLSHYVDLIRDKVRGRARPKPRIKAN